MDNSKKWYQSKAVLGGLVALGAGIAGIFGVSIAEAEQATIVELALQVGSVVGGALAVYGRVKADTSIR